MRIISSFHDYYDGPATMFGQEPLFIRERKELYSGHGITSYRLYEDKLFYYYKTNIVFCNTIYPMIYWQSKDFNNYSHEILFKENPQPDHHDREVVSNCLRMFPHLSDKPVWAFSFGGWDSLLVENPRLRSLDFQVIKDSYTAAQEIDMFLSNIAVRPDREPDPIDDKTKIISHGFDNKTSFRKGKSR